MTINKTNKTMMMLNAKLIEICNVMKADSIKVFLKENGILFEHFLLYPTDMAVTRKAFDGHMITIENNSNMNSPSAVSLKWKFFYKEKMKKYLSFRGDYFKTINIDHIFN